MSALTVNGISVGFYPDEGDAGGTKSYLSHLNAALAASWHAASSSQPAPVINVVGWYAQTYPGQDFTGFQLLPLVEDIKAEYLRTQRAVRFVYEASVMPFQSWSGYTADNPARAKQVAQVMRKLLEQSNVAPHYEADDAELAIAEIRLRFGHEVNYYMSSGLYPPPTNAADPGADFRQAFDQVALACRALPAEFSSRIKMFWCPNIASTHSAAMAEYERFLPALANIDYVGIDYYCPAQGCLTASDFVSKIKPLHDKYASASRPFILGETGLHFDQDERGPLAAKLAWLETVTCAQVRQKLPHLRGVSWFNYEKDRDYRLICVQDGAQRNEHFARWLDARAPAKGRANVGKDGVSKARKFWKTLVSK